MQEWRLAPGISFCLSAGVPIYLDLVRDRYVALPERLRPVFLAWYVDPSRPLPEGLGLLETQGLVERGGDGAAIAPLRWDKAIRPLTADGPPATLAAAPGAIASCFRIGRTLRNGGIAGPLTAIPPRPAELTDVERTKRLAARFAGAQRVLSLRRNCLYNSLALLDFLRRRRADADIVFGVTSSPFRAHCWIQREGWILNDEPDAIAPFTPILVR